MMFIDTSAVVAILARERDAAEYSAKIAAAKRRLCAGHVVLEAAMRLSSLLGVDPRDAEDAITQMFVDAGIEFVPVDAAVAREAVAAFARFGKGRGHRARLNFGDCLSYACARVHGARLLFKGADFTATDIERA